MARYNVIGTMSGTSLDGLDIAYCSFELLAEKWSFKINAAQTVNYSDDLVAKFQSAKTLSGQELMMLDQQFACFTSKSINKFMAKTEFEGKEGTGHGRALNRLEASSKAVGEAIERHIMLKTKKTESFFIRKLHIYKMHYLILHLHWQVF